MNFVSSSRPRGRDAGEDAGVLAALLCHSPSKAEPNGIALRGSGSYLEAAGEVLAKNPEIPFMRAVIQRVISAEVTIDNKVKGKIQQGLVVLLGIEEADQANDIDWLCGKIARLRIFNDESGVMNRSVSEVGGEILVVSQFTLFASTGKGNRPSYSRAARPEIALPLYDQFLTTLGAQLGNPIHSGEFRAHMLVSLINDGPVTIIIDSKLLE